MKSTRILFCILALVLSAAAESLHVTNVFFGARCLSCGPHPVVHIHITGTIGDQRYTLLEQIRYGEGYPTLQVGQDYPVVEVNDKTIKVSLRDKRGKQQAETLNVVAVEKVN